MFPELKVGHHLPETGRQTSSLAAGPAAAQSKRKGTARVMPPKLLGGKRKDSDEIQYFKSPKGENWRTAASL